MNCDRCPWRSPDTCRACQAEEVNKQGLTVVEQRTLRRLYKLSPEHASRARVRELFMVMESIIGKDTITRNLLGEAFALRRQRYEQEGSPRVVENSSRD